MQHNGSDLSLPEMHLKTLNGNDEVDAFGLESDAFTDKAVMDADGGETCTIAVCDNGDVIGWGLALYGELGNGQTSLICVKNTRIPLPARCCRVACGKHHVLALSEEGHVIAWGWNAMGQVGISSQSSIDSPVQIQLPLQLSIKISSIAAGAMHSIAIDTDGHVWTWGNNDYGQLGLGEQANSTIPQPSRIEMTRQTPMKSAAAGYAHSALVARDTGMVYTFGWGLYHQLGHGSIQNQHTPMTVDAFEGIPLSNPITKSTGIVKVACGHWHTAALTATGDVYTWGWGQDGQLGPSARQSEPFPHAVDTVDQYFTDHEAMDVAGGARSTIVLSQNGHVHWWGTPQPSKPNNQQLPTGATRIAAGYSHVVVLCN